MNPSDLGLPAKFTNFRVYPGFDQYETALELSTAHERFQILNAATGSGKSLTAATVAALRKARFLYLVGTKGLQSQLLSDGLVQRLVYGHRNYYCMPRGGFGIDDADSDDSNFSCSVPRDRCGYLGDVNAAAAANSVVANYAYWISIARYSDPKLLGEFDFLVMDEAHGAPDWLVRAVTISLSRTRLHKLLGIAMPTLHADIRWWQTWAAHTADLTRTRLRGIEDRAELRKLTRLLGDLELLNTVSDPTAASVAGLTQPWIVLPDSVTGAVKFSPRWGTDFAEQYLFRGIPHILLTSATVTETHADNLGILKSERRYREAPSPFDPRHRPVVWIPTTRVDFRMTDGAKYKLQQRVDELIGAAIEQGAGNGIIHTGSYERNRVIVASSKWGPAIITHRQDSADFQAALDKFKEYGRQGRFAVLASPRLQEGVDLSHELSRWQIILTVPFPNSQDPLTKARLEDPAFRVSEVMQTMYQMCGRSVRGDTDFATTWILDNRWGEWVRWQYPFAQWFKAAFGTVKEEDAIKSGGFEFLTQEVVQNFTPLKPIEMLMPASTTFTLMKP